MTEFKVDKLGRYEGKYTHAEGVRIFNVIHKLNDSFVALQDDNENCFQVYEDGRDVEWTIELTKYLGPEISKEHRKFEFEAYLTEFPEEKYGSNPNFDLVFGYAVSEFYSEKPKSNYRKHSKWKVTMEEIIE